MNKIVLTLSTLQLLHLSDVSTALLRSFRLYPPQRGWTHMRHCMHANVPFPAHLLQTGQDQPCDFFCFGITNLNSKSKQKLCI